ncbi:MAG: hypothetical protein JKY50_00135 [Oleispira sp.]|nr:hypothetical protein [Oleispira sp.]
MGLFNPSGEVSLAPEQGVVEPSGGLIQGLTQALGVIKTDNKGNSTSKKDQLQSSLFRDIERAQAIGNQRGASAGLLAEKKVLANYLKLGGNLDATTREGLGKITGKPFDFIGSSIQETSENTVLTSSEGQEAIIAARHTNPDATDTEIRQIAIDSVSQDTANARKIATSQVQGREAWLTGGGSTAALARIDLHTNKLQGLNSLNADGASIEDVRTLQNNWSAFKTTLRQPKGVTNEDYQEVSGKLKAVDDLFSVLLSNRSDEVLGQSMIKAATNEMLGPKTEDTAKERLLRGLWLKGGLDLSKTNLITNAIGDLFKNAETRMPVEDMNTIVQTGGDRDGLETTTRELPVADNTKILIDMNAFLNSFSPADLDDPVTKEYVTATLLGTSMHMKVSEGHYTEKSVRNFFSDKVIGQVQAVAKSEPDAGKNLTTAMLEGLDTLELKNKLNLTEMARDANISVDLQTGDITLDEQRILAAVGVKRFAALKKHLDVDFGGDVSALLRSNLSEFAKETRGQDIAKFLFQGGRQNLANIQERVRTHRFLQDKRGQLTPLLGEADTPELEGAAGADVISEGAPTLQEQGISSGFGLIKSKEGFRNKAYWDVNHWRVGYGSDTITAADGTTQSVTEQTTTTRGDADRDLERRYGIFQAGASKKIGEKVFNSFPEDTKQALTSITYNYGSVPDRLISAAKSGDLEALAVAVEGLAGDNNGINRQRRLEEASLIRGAGNTLTGGGALSFPAPQGRPEDLSTGSQTDLGGSESPIGAPSAASSAPQAVDPAVGLQALVDESKDPKEIVDKVLKALPQGFKEAFLDQLKTKLAGASGIEEVQAAIEDALSGLVK